MSKSLYDGVRLDVSVYRRDARNYPENDQLLNTGISYPIAFDHAVIYGAEAKLDLVQTRNLSGFVSYSYMVGNVWFPVTGGLFLGDDAAAALSQTSGHFPDSQDQRNTLRTRFEYRLTPRFLVASGRHTDPGYPSNSAAIKPRQSLNMGRRSSAASIFRAVASCQSTPLNPSMRVDAYNCERPRMHLQIDADNLNNRLNVIDFGGLFSGNAIGPARSYSARLSTSF